MTLELACFLAISRYGNPLANGVSGLLRNPNVNSAAKQGLKGLHKVALNLIAPEVKIFGNAKINIKWEFSKGGRLSGNPALCDRLLGLTNALGE